jgi:hypothetical protein
MSKSAYNLDSAGCMANIEYIKHKQMREMVGSLKMNTALEYSTRVVQEGDRRCKKSTLNDLAYLTPLRIPLMNPIKVYIYGEKRLHGQQ